MAIKAGTRGNKVNLALLTNEKLKDMVTNPNTRGRDLRKINKVMELRGIAV